VAQRDYAARSSMKKKKKQKQIGELDSYLSLDINEKELQKVYKSIKEAEKKLIKDQVKMTDLEQKRSIVSSRAMSAKFEFNKYVESYLNIRTIRNSSRARDFCSKSCPRDTPE